MENKIKRKRRIKEKDNKLILFISSNLIDYFNSLI